LGPQSRKKGTEASNSRTLKRNKLKKRKGAGNRGRSPTSASGKKKKGVSRKFLGPERGGGERGDWVPKPRLTIQSVGVTDIGKR